MIAEPLLIDAPIKQDGNYTPAWWARADWSSRNALLAYWSAHPPELRKGNAYLEARAESFIANMWAQIKVQRAEQSRLWQARRDLMDWELKKIQELPADSLNGHRHREFRDEAKAKLLALRAQMKVSRAAVRKCIKYLRVIQPKVVKFKSGVRHG